jgi:hypothetical protein
MIYCSQYKNRNLRYIDPNHHIFSKCCRYHMDIRNLPPAFGSIITTPIRGKYIPILFGGNGQILRGVWRSST